MVLVIPVQFFTHPEDWLEHLTPRFPSPPSFHSIIYSYIIHHYPYTSLTKYSLSIYVYITIIPNYRTYIEKQYTISSIISPLLFLIHTSTPSSPTISPHSQFFSSIYNNISPCIPELLSSSYISTASPPLTSSHLLFFIPSHHHTSHHFPSLPPLLPLSLSI